MPKLMKVKIFMDVKATVVEEQINAWLDYAGAADPKSVRVRSHS